MKKWFVWMCICTICMSMLLYIGSFFEFTGNKMKLLAPVKVQKENEYIGWEERKIEENLDYKNIGIYIDINEKKLELINLDNNEVLKKYMIASGKPSTPSPIGNWKVIGKSSWGKGFGTRWMGLNVPWGKYGIHGTNKPNSIGWASSHGCIRMRNKDVEELYRFVKVGMPVAIRGGVFGPFGNGFRTLEPGFRGSDVYEVQRYMKEKGYYPGWIDGIYGEGMKSHVIQFRKDHNLPLSHNVDGQFYKTLGIELFE